MRTFTIKSAGLIIAFITISLYGKAQVNIGFGANGKIFGLPSSQFIGGTSSCNIWLKNCGSAMVTLNGYLTTYVDTTVSGPHLLQNDSIQNVSIGAGDSVLFSFGIYYKYGRCRVGNNILVIWPSIVGGNTQLAGCDTLTTDSIDILGGGGLSMEESNYMQAVFPNPVRDQLHIQLMPGQHQPEYVSILDVSGREWLLKPYSTDVISLEGLENGVYIVRLLFADNRRSVNTRIVKME